MSKTSNFVRRISSQSLHRSSPIQNQDVRLPADGSESEYDNDVDKSIRSPIGSPESNMYHTLQDTRPRIKHFHSSSMQLPTQQRSDDIERPPFTCPPESNGKGFEFPQDSSASSLVNSDVSSPPFSSFNAEIADKKFTKHLLMHAKEVAGETQDPIELDHPILKVELEILKGQGSHTTRSSQEGNVRNTNNGPIGNVKINEIFGVAERESENEARTKCLNLEARQRYVWKHGNRVLVTGQAGIGKSTFTRMMLQHIIDRKVLPETKYIFYIQCRDIEFNEKLDLFEFLLKYSSSEDVEFSNDEKKSIIKAIDKSNNVVVIFDAMDQAQTEDLSKSDVKKCRLIDCVQVSALVRCLMNSQLLPRAKMMVTCRTRQAYQFAPEYRPSVVFRILGLCSESQKNLGKQICGRNFNSTYNIIRKDEDLESTCYISVFCVILYAVLNKASDQRQDTILQLNSITRVMVYLLDKYLRSDHMREVSLQELKKVSELARKGFFQKLLVFSPELISEIGIAQPALQGFMVTYIDNETKLRYRIFEGEHKFSFSHQLWQEFFTAIDLMFFAPWSDFDACLNQMNSAESYSRWEIVSKFLYGFTNKNTFEFIHRHLLPVSKGISDRWEERKQILWTTSEYYVNRHNHDSNQLLQVCNWIQETDDHSFTMKVSSRFTGTFRLAGSDDMLTVGHHDVRSIARIFYVVAEYSTKSPISSLDFDNVEFTQNSFRVFASQLSKYTGVFQEMRFNNCEFGNSAGNQIIRFMEKTERLHISYCNLSNEDILVMKDHYKSLQNLKLEVWVFHENNPPEDFGEELRRRISCTKKVPVEQG